MDVIELRADEKILKLTIEDNFWCQVYLVEDKEEIRLGADCLNSIISKLFIAFMPSQNKKHYQHCGIEMFTVMCLMDPHSVIAGSEKSETESKMIFIDTEGNIRPMMTLTTEIEVDWIKQICKYLTNKYRYL